MKIDKLKLQIAMGNEQLSGKTFRKKRRFRGNYCPLKKGSSGSKT